MRRIPRLGFLNLALVSLYFAPIWAREALRILLLPYRAFEDRSHAVVAIWLREAFDLTLEGLMRISGALALAAIGVAIWSLPPFLLADPTLIRLSATQVMLVAGAVAVVTVEGHIEDAVTRDAVPAVAPMLDAAGVETQVA